MESGADFAGGGAGRAVATVDLSALTANVAFLRSRLTGGAGLCAVVKADGYGHGLAEAARAAVAGGASRLAVATVSEAEQIASLDLGLPVLMLAPAGSHELTQAVLCGAELTVWSREQADAIAEVSAKLGRQARLHIKLDTGMGRYGAREEAQALDALDAAAAADGAEAIAIWTHFATADQRGDDYFPLQLERFAAFVDQARAAHPELLAHAANSAALLREPASHFDFVRPGVAIYGLDPFGEDAPAQGLSPALGLTSYVAGLRDVAAGESVGYGRAFVAATDVRIATVPIGYGDGWRRILSNKSEVLIAGRRCPQRGTVSMDSIMVEVGPDVEVGQPVTLIGGEGREAISAEQVARWAQTINYEITCGLTPRTVRVYRPGG